MIEALIFGTLIYIAYLIERLNNNVYLMMDGVRLIPGAINDLKKRTENHNKDIKNLIEEARFEGYCEGYNAHETEIEEDG